MKKSLKLVLKRLPIYWSIRNWRNKRRQAGDVAAWEAKGCPVPPPHIIKQRTLLEYAATHNLQIFVETGTFLGDMIEAMRGSFESLFSIELDNALCNMAKSRFRRRDHIQIVNGDSAKVLGDIVRSIDRPALFWLDGHYSGGVTARGLKDTPVLEELKIILDAPDRGHVIIIDDARCFGKDCDYPTIEALGLLVGSMRDNMTVTVRDDMIRVTPAKPPIS